MDNSQNLLSASTSGDPFMGKPMSASFEFGCPSMNAANEEIYEDKSFPRNLLQNDEFNDVACKLNGNFKIDSKSSVTKFIFSAFLTSLEPMPVVNRPISLDGWSTPKSEEVPKPVVEDANGVPVLPEMEKIETKAITKKKIIILKSAPSVPKTAPITPKMVPIMPKPVAFVSVNEMVSVRVQNDTNFTHYKKELPTETPSNLSSKARQKRIRYTKTLEKNTPEYHFQRRKNNDSVRRSRAKKEAVNRQNEIDLARLHDDNYLLRKRLNEFACENYRLRSILEMHHITY